MPTFPQLLQQARRGSTREPVLLEGGEHFPTSGEAPDAGA